MTGSEIIRILVAENEEPLRVAICALFANEPSFEVVAVAADADEAIAKAAAVQPDVAVLDVRMPGGGGPRAAGEIALVSTQTRVLGVSAREDRTAILEMLRAGAIGYLVKGQAPEEIVDGVRRAHRGQASFSADTIVAIVDDVAREANQRGEAFEIMRQADVRFRSLLDSITDPVMILDEAGTIELANGQAERMFGYERDELVGLTVDVLLLRRSRAAHRQARLDHFSSQESRPSGMPLEVVALRKDRSEFPATVSFSAIATSGAPTAAVLVRDVTSAREDSQVENPEQPVEAILDSAPDAIVVVDKQGRIVLVNKQTERLFDFDRDELLGEPIEVLLPTRSHEQHVESRDAYLAKPMPRTMAAELEPTGRRRDGSEFPVDISLSSIDIKKGRLVVAFIRDVTERRARASKVRGVAERRAMLEHFVSAAEDERRRIAGDIHDDSIQVISAAAIYLQILRSSLTDPEQRNQLTQLEQTIELSISRLRHLIFELRPPTLDNEGLSAALRAYLVQADNETSIAHHLDDHLTSQPPENTRLILYRISQEVLTNARKHAEAENVTVKLGRQHNGYHVRIEDDGIGFIPDLVSDHPGHLGLAAIRERAELANGWLRVDSSVGQGTKIEFWIPEDTPAI